MTTKNLVQYVLMTEIDIYRISMPSSYDFNQDLIQTRLEVMRATAVALGIISPVEHVLGAQAV